MQVIDLLSDDKNLFIESKKNDVIEISDTDSDTHEEYDLNEYSYIKKNKLKIGKNHQINIPILINSRPIEIDDNEPLNQNKILKENSIYSKRKIPPKIDYKKGRKILKVILPLFKKKKKFFEKEYFMTNEILNGFNSLYHKKNTYKIQEIEDDLPMIKYLYYIALDNFDNDIENI